MRPDVRRDLSASAWAFEAIIWPAIRGVCGGGRMCLVELHGSDMAADLDCHAGIDAMQIYSGGMRGIASRVQFVPRGKSWRSFTIRETRTSGVETEYMKRVESIRQAARGRLIPELTVQAYIGGEPKASGARLERVLIAYTVDVYAFLAECERGMHGGLVRRENPDDGNVFFVVWADKMRRANYRVCEYPKAPARYTQRYCK